MLNASVRVVIMYQLPRERSTTGKYGAFFEAVRRQMPFFRQNRGLKKLKILIEFFLLDVLFASPPI